MLVESMDCLHKYDPKHFTKVADKDEFCFDMSVTYDIAKRVANGELNGDKESAIDLMHRLKDEYGDSIEPL